MNNTLTLVRCEETTAEPLLRAENLWKTYRDGQVEAVRGVSLAVNPGEYVAIQGPSGSGKSTLLNLLGALDLPDEGELYLNGTSYRCCRDLNQFRASQLGFVFQSFCLLPALTAVENVQVPLIGTEHSRIRRTEKARDLLERVGLSHRLDHLPSRLSVGERQRVALARALINEPKLLLADEPTGNLDSERTEEILTLLDTLRRERALTLIIVTHSQEVANCADRTLFYCDGRIQREELLCHHVESRRRLMCAAVA